MKKTSFLGVSSKRSCRSSQNCSTSASSVLLVWQKFGLLWYWMVCLGNRDHSVIFEIASKYCISDSFVDYVFLFNFGLIFYNAWLLNVGLFANMWKIWKKLLIIPSNRILYARQQKRHTCIEQSFGLCGGGRGWGDLGEWHWNMYINICEMNRQSRFDAWYRMLRAVALGWPRGMG